MESAKYDNRSVYWRVINEIIDGIRERKYKPGDRLPTELELMKKTELSRGSVREAIKILSALGIVSIRRGEGTFISDADEMPALDSIGYTLLLYTASPEELLEFRYHIDDMVLRIVVGKITEENIQELEAIIEEAERAYAADDIERVKELDTQFHMKILDFTGNHYVKRAVGGSYEFFIPEFIKRNPNSQKFYEEAVKSHREIVEFFRTKDYSILESGHRYRNSEVYYEYPGIRE